MRRQPMAHQRQEMALKIDHGYTDNQVTIVFSQPVGNLLFTLEQAEQLIKNIRISMDALVAHQKSKQ